MSVKLRFTPFVLAVSLAVSLLTQEGIVQATVRSRQAKSKSNSTISKRKLNDRFQTRPASFRDFADCVRWLKKSVYLVVRGRPQLVEGKILIQWITLGSGFLAAPYRFLTAGHVINDPSQGKELALHKAGDTYYLLRNDGDSFHWRSFTPELNKELFIYPDKDIAIIYLDEEFYKTGEAFGLTKDDYLRVDTNLLPIGSSVGILGYPLTKLEFENFDFQRPRAGNIILRADTGVINARYKTQQGPYVYEFTLMFNPGNSGGPIFDTRTGKVISLVKGYRSVPIKVDEKVITDEEARQLRVYKERAYIEVTHAMYSLGMATATPEFIDLLRKHDIIK